MTKSDDPRDGRWLYMPGWETRYGVHEDGRIFNLDTGKVMTATPPKPGASPRIRVLMNGRERWFTVARWVCEAFHGKQSAERAVVHLDGDVTHNHEANLRWGTRKEAAAAVVARHGMSSPSQRALGQALQAARVDAGLEVVQMGVANLAAIEVGRAPATFAQVVRLAELYRTPLATFAMAVERAEAGAE